MKKLFVSALAILGLVACAKDDVVSVQDNRSAIGFDTYVENVTRVGYTTDNLDGFDVWAYMGDTRILTDEDVTGGYGNYAYGNTQYWIPGQPYFFAALAPLNSYLVDDANVTKEGLGEITFTNVDGTTDLIYSTYSVTADGSQDKVNFQFNHLLSKVKFSFVNEFDNANYAFTVSNITMTAPEKASIDLTANGYTWYNHAGEITLDFGDNPTEKASMGNTVSSTDLLTIPAGNTQEYNVTFDVNLYVAGALARTYNKEAKISGIAFEAGKGYSLTATIDDTTFNLEKIDFDATVNDWDETSAPQYQPYQVEVAGENYDDLAVACEKAIELNKPVNFFQHVVVDADTTITVPAGEELTLNLNGYTLTGVTDQTGSNHDMFTVNGTMTVNGAPITRAAAAANGTISVKHIGTDMGTANCTDVFRVMGNGELNLNGVTAKNIGGTYMAYVVDMSNATDLSVNIKDSTLDSTYIPVRVFNNSTTGKHNVTINNTSLTGKKYCVWVQYGIAEGRDQATLDATVFLNVYNPDHNNTFTYTSAGPVMYGFDKYVVFNENGVKVSGFEDYDEFLETLSDDTWYDDTKAELAIEDVADFAAFVETANSGNDFDGKTIKLAGDIDLYFEDVTVNADGDPITFRPIGDTKYGDEPFRGTFDGQGNTIKNLYQNGWDLGYHWDNYGSYGLFGKLENATVKNVVIEGSESYIEGGDVSFIAGSATGDCVFENITINSGVAATYNNGCGGIIGWSGAGNYTFKNIVLGKDVVLGGLWGSFDSSIGGIVGQAEPGATYNFENVTINCRIDAYNDCTASYDYYNYRMCGMIIGRCEETTTIDGANYPDLSKYNLSFNNVTVNYGDWMNYHYCRVSGQRAVRVEPGYAYDGIAADRDHSKDNQFCMEWIPFNQLIGGDQYAVKGLPAVDGVTVNYPESFYREQGYKVEGDTYSIYSGQGFKEIATTVLADGSKNVTIELANDIDLAGIEWPAVATNAAFVFDGKGKTIKNLTTSAVESNGFYCTALFSSTRKATTIKNLVVENATVTGNGQGDSHGAVLVATNWAALNIEGVTVKGSTVSNCDRSSVLVTFLYFTGATVKDCVVDGCTVNSIGTAGALLGINNSNDFTATGNTVKGTTISSSEGSNKAGILIGTWQNAGTLTESENVVEDSKAINAGTETNNNIGRTV